MKKIQISYEKNFFEYAAWSKNKRVCGIDEVGRGCLAGPLVVCAAILHPHAQHPLLQDSKKLTAKQRETAYEWIISNAYYTFAYADPYAITQHNIYQATLRAMQKACLFHISRYQSTWNNVEYIVVDAMPLTLSLPAPSIHFFPFGEQQSTSIAAASILAKVTRDRLMCRMNNLFPRFSFSAHKGYGTQTHRMTLQSHHATLVHRPSFLTKIIGPDI